MSPCSSFLEPGSQSRAYSRKEKSLGLLCTNFVRLYNQDDTESVCLDDAAEKLGVERRRIYDIVNVLESVGVLAKKAKGKYSWIGFSGIPKALDELKKDSAENANDKSIDQNEDFEEAKLSQTSNASSTKATLKAKSASHNKKEKSLGLLAQNFVKLFLNRNADTISLDEVARLLLGDDHDESIMRSNNAAKVRRLYDIANILSSVDLIEKTQQAGTRKPAFRWLGIEGKQDNSVTVAISSISANQWNKRLFGTDITNMDFKRTKLNYSVDRKPSQVHTTSDDLKGFNQTAQKQLQESKGYVFGPFCPTEVAKGGDNTEEKTEKKAQDWETLASSFRPQYHNQALSELFAHYMEAWKSWYVEVVQKSTSSQPPYHSIANQLLHNTTVNPCLNG